ncbi:MAG TPA: flagellar protein FliS [Caldithrix sp.]|nr:flagellar protein FliS [Caldithrix sp.]
MNTALSYHRPTLHHKGVSTYQQNQILNLSATELILKLYDLAIIAIKKKDVHKANRVITELIGALNFDYQDVAIGFFRLYRFCQDRLYKGDFDQVLRIFEDLRKTWAEAYNLT